ncbi:two-component sensor histidine kinase [Amycolatopsis antarctica]|uniref:histidine kinase n=1 Tax=Amycolatopsis antarctica TaxID=1854586 RepID=A0A263D670_9PSEU|nr:histidine kinase [Amycolatopsis antarctica]OZM72905.1 two-component sensor histidine kinase [Amycolatopsis antarctica]
MTTRVRLLPARLSDLPEWLQDVLVVVISLAIGLTLYLTDFSPLHTEADWAPDWLRPVLFAAICLAELFRRRAPAFAVTAGLVLVVVDGLLGVTMPMWIVYADLLYAATLYGSRRLGRVTIPAAAVGMEGAVLASVILVHDWRATIVSSVTALPFIVIPVWWAANIRQHQELAATERANAAQLVRIAELDRRAAVAAERARMSRELHDAIAGYVSAIAIQADAALSMNQAQSKTMRTVLDSIRENSVRALEEMQAMIGLLSANGAGADDEASPPAKLSDLPRLVESARASGLAIDVRSELGETASIPGTVGLTAYRITQEALTNAVKHAPNSKANLDIRRTHGSLVVEVTNELTAASSAEAGCGAGLLNMRNRATAVGGSFDAGPDEPGWSVRAVLPIEEGQY